MKNLLKNLGVLLVIIGAVILIISHFTTLHNDNAVTFGAVGVCIAGLVVHIIMNKKYAD